MSVDASHGGASHDSYVCNDYPIKHFLHNLDVSENETLWLLGKECIIIFITQQTKILWFINNNNDFILFSGDSGYTLHTTMMTPIVDTEPNTPQ